MEDSHKREAERLEADLRVQEQANVERYRLEHHRLALEAAREVSPEGSTAVSPPPEPVTEPQALEAGIRDQQVGNIKPLAIPDGSKASWRARRFFLTLNDVERYDRLMEYLKSRPYTYLVAAYEEAPTTLHEHVHIFVLYKEQVKLVQSKTEGADVEVARGTPAQSRDYVKKEGNILFEDGVCPEDSQKKSALTIRQVRDMPKEEILDLRASAYRYIRDIKSDLLNETIRENKHVKPIDFEWYYGPTGTGKSRTAMETGGTPVIYDHGFFSDWGEAKIIILEEFRGEIPYPKMLQLTDRYHGYYTFNIKGGQRVLDIQKLIVTSPYRPEECYRQQVQKTDSIQQLMRRITRLVHFQSSGDATDEDPREIRVPEVPDFGVQNGLVSSRYH